MAWFTFSESIPLNFFSSTCPEKCSEKDYLSDFSKEVKWGWLDCSSSGWPFFSRQIGVTLSSIARDLTWSLPIFQRRCKAALQGHWQVLSAVMDVDPLIPWTCMSWHLANKTLTWSSYTADGSSPWMLSLSRKFWETSQLKNKVKKALRSSALCGALNLIESHLWSTMI